jgi:transmembrane sensor
MDLHYFEEISIRYLSDEASVTEKEMFEDVITNNTELQIHFEELKKIWHTPSVEASQLDLDSAWKEISDRLVLNNIAPNELRERLDKLPIGKFWTIAASILFVIGSVWLYQSVISEWTMSNPPSLSQVDLEEQTQHGERRTIVLPDQSEVNLNVGTTLHYESTFSDSLRLVHLDGEAFFEVESDGRPFVVQTPTTLIRVLGTSFNVRSRERTTTVIVKEGVVSVQNLNKTSGSGMILSLGEKSIHRPGESITLPEMVDTEKAIGWLRGELVFKGIPIEQVMAELTRVFDVEIIVNDDKIRPRTITAI